MTTRDARIAIRFDALDYALKVVFVGDALEEGILKW